MADRIWQRFMREQLKAASALTAESDIVEIHAERDGQSVPSRYLVRYNAPCLVCEAGGAVTRHDGYAVSIRFPVDYLRQVVPIQIVAWVLPASAFHPNLNHPFLCLGAIMPGTPLVDLVYRIYELASYMNFAPADGLNPAACQWARHHMAEFPITRRPMKRRKLDMVCDVVQSGGRP